jgi:TonB family protein
VKGKIFVMYESKKLLKLSRNGENKKKRELLFIFLSLVIHLLLVYFICVFGFHKVLFTIIAPAKDRKKDSDLPASLKPKKSQLGTYVFFEDAPTSLPDVIPKIPPEKEIKDRPSDADDSKQKKLMAQAQQVEKVKEVLEESKKVDFENKVLSKAEKEVEEIISKEIEKAISELLPEVVEKQSAVEERIKEIEAKQAQLAQAQKMQDKEKVLEDKIEFKKEKAEKKESKRKNIIAMTKGFLDNIKDEGNDWLERKGDDNKMPSFEELKFTSYEERVNWCLQASWKRNFAHLMNHSNLQGKAVIDFAIDETGKIVSSKLLQSSGHRELDDMIIKNLAFAAPFPPLPKHFNMKTYSTGRIIHVYSNRFGF